MITGFPAQRLGNPADGIQLGVHKSMVSRGFSDASEMFDEKKSPEKSDYIYLLSIIIIAIILEIIIIKYSGQLGYIGQNLAIN